MLAGYTIVPDFGAEILAESDTVIVPGTKLAGPRSDGTLPDRVAEAFATIPSHARVMSICTGAFVLGAAGLLDAGRRPPTGHTPTGSASCTRRCYSTRTCCSSTTATC